MSLWFKSWRFGSADTFHAEPLAKWERTPEGSVACFSHRANSPWKSYWRANVILVMTQGLLVCTAAGVGAPSKWCRLIDRYTPRNFLKEECFRGISGQPTITLLWPVQMLRHSRHCKAVSADQSAPLALSRQSAAQTTTKMEKVVTNQFGTNERGVSETESVLSLIHI